MSDTPPTDEGPPSTDPDAPADPGAPADGEASRHALRPRTTPMRRFMAAPLLFATALMLATAALVVLVWIGGTPEGARVSIPLRGTCAAEARELVAARAAEIGLGDPQLEVRDGALVVTATLPGLEDDEAKIPALLAARGWLEIAQGDTVLVDRTAVIEASLRLDEGGTAYTWLDLMPDTVPTLEAALEADPEGDLTIRLDSEIAAIRPNSRGIKDGGIRVSSPGELTPRERMRIAADTVIRLNHGPLPCALSPGPLTPVASP